MLMLLCLSILVASISIWDFFSQERLKEYLLCKKLEVIMLLIAVDMLTGVLVFKLMAELGLDKGQLVIVGIMMLCCGLFRQYKNDVLGQYLSTVAFWWLLTPYFLNTIFVIALLILLFTKNWSRTNETLVIISIPVFVYFVTENVSLMLLILVISLLYRSLFKRRIKEVQEIKSNAAFEE